MRWLRRALWVVKGAMLIVCLALCVLWVRSYWRGSRLGYVVYAEQDGDTAVDSWESGSDSGSVWASVGHWRYAGWTAAEVRARWANAPDMSPGWHRSSDLADADRHRRYSGDAGWGPVWWGDEQGSGLTSRSRQCEVHVRHWLAALLCGAWPLTSLALATRRAVRRRGRARRGLCPSCGYDLRATADGSGGLLPRCPECGREPRPLATDAHR